MKRSLDSCYERGREHVIYMKVGEIGASQELVCDTPRFTCDNYPQLALVGPPNSYLEKYD